MRLFALGVGMSSAADPTDVREAVAAVLGEAGLAWDEVSLVGTARHLAGDGRLALIGAEVVGFDRSDLEAVPVPSGAGPAATRLSAPPVAEAAALLAADRLAAGAGSRLIVAKRTGRYVTVAAAEGAVHPL